MKQYPPSGTLPLGYNLCQRLGVMLTFGFPLPVALTILQRSYTVSGLFYLLILLLGIKSKLWSSACWYMMPCILVEI